MVAFKYRAELQFGSGMQTAELVGRRCIPSKIPHHSRTLKANHWYDGTGGICADSVVW